MDSFHLVNSNAVSAGQASFWGLPAAAGKSPLVAAGQVFNVFHVGVVLRAVLWVNGAWVIGVMLGVKTPMEWLLHAALVVRVAPPCVLLWLALACAGVFHRCSESKILALKTLNVRGSALHAPLRFSS